MKNAAQADPNGPQVLSVSELNRQARVTIEERFHTIWVTGEMSNFARPRSGHWYFSLKDDRAQVRCAMFANRNRAAAVQPADGQLVVVRGRVSLYEGRGDFQIIVDQIEAAGTGALQRAFELLQRKLASEGLFATDRKRRLPAWPRHIAVVTSPTGAALRDVLAVWQRRFPALVVTVVPTLVQGEAAEAALLNAIAQAQQLPADVLLLTRGGGSLEDLWAFNLESVARALAASDLPTVCAVGHEIDTTICDYIADLRAPTPSAAAELLVPERDEVLERLHTQTRRLWHATRNHVTIARLQLSRAAGALQNPQSIVDQAHLRLEDRGDALQRGMQARLLAERSHLSYLQRHLRTLGPAAALHNARVQLASQKRALGRVAQHMVADTNNRLHLQRQRLGAQSPHRYISMLSQRVSSARDALQQAVSRRIQIAQQQLGTNVRMLNNLSPLPTLERGYAIVRNPAGEIISDVGTVHVDNEIDTWLANGRIRARVVDVDPGAKLGD